jgi:hypothetical protein
MIERPAASTSLLAFAGKDYELIHRTWIGFFYALGNEKMVRWRGRENTDL